MCIVYSLTVKLRVSFSPVGEQVVSHTGFALSRTLSADGRFEVVVPLPSRNLKKRQTAQEKCGFLDPRTQSHYKNKVFLLQGFKNTVKLMLFGPQASKTQ